MAKHRKRKKVKAGHTPPQAFPPPGIPIPAEVMYPDALASGGVDVVAMYDDAPPAGPPSAEQLAEFHKSIQQLRKGLKLCLAPGCAAKGKAIIKAHSLSQGKVLRRLAIDGKVWALHGEGGPNKEDGTYEVVSPFKLIGIGEATTFTGLCGEHDNSIFEMIDNGDIDTGNQEYLFRLAYRAILRKTYEQKCGLHHFKDKRMPVRRTADGGLIDQFTFQMQVVPKQIIEYKERIDKMLVAGDWAGMRHKIFQADKVTPNLAAADLIPLDDIDRDSTAMAVLTILPAAQGVVVIFSSTADDYPELESYAGRHLNAPPTSKRFREELTRAVLSTENFVISPALWDKLSADRQQQIIQYFMAMLMDYPPAHFQRRFSCFG